MGVDPLAGYGLRPVLLTDRPTLEPYFASLAEPLSDYTFSQLYTWSRSLKMAWRVMAGHLCVFANGTGDLTLLMPPLGDTGGDRALAEAFEVMDDYNRSHGVPDESRVEYVSDECLARFDRTRLRVEPLAADYVYDVRRMIDLAGGDLSSKRQAKNRFLRLYGHRIEAYDPVRHMDECRRLLSTWKAQQDARHADESDIAALKRNKEADSVEAYLQSAGEMGVTGMVVYVRGDAVPNQPVPIVDDPAWRLRGFTFGEPLAGGAQCAIAVEKTDLQTKGLAQFIFSEFCRRNWSDRPLVNVGDAWGLESLAWTKNSYRPVKMLQKYTLRKATSVMAVVPSGQPRSPTQRRPASRERERAVPPGANEPLAHTRGSPRAPVVPDGGSQKAVAPGVPSSCPLITHHSSLVTCAQVTVRAATASDVAGAVALEQACFEGDVRLSERQLTYLQRRDSAVFLIAIDDGQVVGEGIALIRQHKSRGGRTAPPSGRVYSLGVHPDHRGQHLGCQLLQAMLAHLVARGVRRVYLEVGQDNARAIALYERLGFRWIGYLPDYYGPGRTASHMICELAQPALIATSA